MRGVSLGAAAVLSCALVIAADGAAALTCGATRPYVFRRDNCTDVAACEAALCRCMGAASYVAPAAGNCLRTLAATPSCPTVGVCVSNYVECLIDLNRTAANITSPCAVWSLDLHAEVILLVTGTPYNSTKLFPSCRQTVCETLNASGARGCAGSFGHNDTDICRYVPPPTPAPTTASPAPTVSNVTDSNDSVVEEVSALSGAKRPSSFLAGLLVAATAAMLLVL